MSHKENVERGAALLDQQYPGWFNELDVASLDMSDCDACVVGQVADKRYSGATWEMGLYDCEDDVRHGFDLEYPPNSSTKDWAGLKAEWIKQIEKKRG